MLPTVVYLFPGNTMMITVANAKDRDSGQLLQNANVTATMYDRRNNPDPVLRNIPMTLVSGTLATYRGQVPATFSATLGGGYTLLVTVEQAGIQSKYSIPAIVQLRKQ